MLFDLRGSGRRRTVKIVYITPAFLMGGGLVLFGIGGGGALSGGLVDAITSSNGGGDVNVDRFRTAEQKATAEARADPKNAELWATVARARFNLASAGENVNQSTGEFSSEGTTELLPVTRSMRPTAPFCIGIASRPEALTTLEPTARSIVCSSSRTLPGQ